jgi:hypothetical protein
MPTSPLRRGSEAGSPCRSGHREVLAVAVDYYVTVVEAGGSGRGGEIGVH